MANANPTSSAMFQCWAAALYAAKNTTLGDQAADQTPLGDPWSMEMGGPVGPLSVRSSQPRAPSQTLAVPSSLAVASRAVVMIVGGWIVLRTGGGVAGLAVVAALGLATAGGMVSTAYCIRMRHKTGVPR